MKVEFGEGYSCSEEGEVVEVVVLVEPAGVCGVLFVVILPLDELVDKVEGGYRWDKEEE